MVCVVITEKVWVHLLQVIHMDLKSKNILLSKEKNLAKITDVGLSRVVNSICGVSRGDGKRNSTEPTFQLGTFEYTAPEVFLGRPCNEKIDIYALGVVLWEVSADCAYALGIVLWELGADPACALLPLFSTIH